MIDKETIIGFDFQGWPICKKNIRDILQGFGLQLIDGKWQIEDTNPILNIYPVRLEDDGMGYGVHEQWIVEAHTHIADEKINQTFCNIFTETEEENIKEKVYGKETKEK